MILYSTDINKYKALKYDYTNKKWTQYRRRIVRKKGMKYAYMTYTEQEYIILIKYDKRKKSNRSDKSLRISKSKKYDNKSIIIMTLEGE